MAKKVLHMHAKKSELKVSKIHGFRIDLPVEESVAAYFAEKIEGDMRLVRVDRTKKGYEAFYAVYRQFSDQLGKRNIPYWERVLGAGELGVRFHEDSLEYKAFEQLNKAQTH